MTSWFEKGRNGARWDKLMALAARKLEPSVRRAFIEAVGKIKSDIKLAELERYLADGQIAAAEQTAAYEGSLGGLKSAVQQSLLTAAAEELQNASEVIRSSFSLDHFNPKVVEYAQQHSARLVQQVSRETRENITEAVTEALKVGQHPRETAREIRDMIGLTKEQRAAVRNYRKALKSGDLNALKNALRDKRSDAKLVRTFLADKRITRDEIDRLVDRYTQRWINFRAETIARTESIRSLAAGNRLAWNQIADSGFFAEGDLYRRWFVAPDERVCEWCAPIPRMNKDGVPLNGYFDTPKGQMQDPPVHPRCRCVIFTRPR